MRDHRPCYMRQRIPVRSAACARPLARPGDDDSGAVLRKASHSITGPTGDIIRPEGIEFLDYEVELGLVIGVAGVTVADAAGVIGVAR